MSTIVERDHRADVIEALGEWATCFDVEGLTIVAAGVGGVGKIDSPAWTHLLHLHRIEGGEQR